MSTTGSPAPVFQVAAGSIDITPKAPLPPSMYHPHRPFAAISDPLEANVVVLRYGDAVCALVSFDLLYVSIELRDAIAARVSGLIASENLFINASHTHFAPATDRRLPSLGPVSDAYFAGLADKVAAQLKSILARTPDPVSLSYVTGAGEHSINRRLAVFGLRRRMPILGTHWEMRPNPQGPRDDVIRVLAIKGTEGQTVAVCWGYSCHPVGFPRKDQISADFPGVVRRALRSAYGSIPIVFWQGFSGDVRPRTVRPAGRNRLRMVEAPSFEPFNDDSWNAWSGSLAARVVHISQMPGRSLDGGIRCTRRTVAMSEFGPDTGGRDLTVQEIEIGSSLLIFGVSAEVVASYVDLLNRVHAPADVIPVGCIDGVPGYLPTDEIVQEGGYEARGFMKRFDVRGRYRPDVTQLAKALIFAAR